MMKCTMKLSRWGDGGGSRGRNGARCGGDGGRNQTGSYDERSGRWSIKPSAWGLPPPFAVAVSILGAGYAVGRIGSAALGVAAEKPELLTPAASCSWHSAEGLARAGLCHRHDAATENLGRNA